MIGSTPHEQFLNIIKSFSTCMLITHDRERSFGGRPMAIARVDSDGYVYMATSLDSLKINEITANPDVQLVFQSSSQFAILRGAATVENDQALIDELWHGAWKVWFPGGKKDPSLCIVRIAPTDGEYWDQRGTKGVRYFFSSVSALVHGTRPTEDSTQHQKVGF